MRIWTCIAIISDLVAKFVPPAAPVTEIITTICAAGAFIFEKQDLGRGVILAFIAPCVLHWVSSQ